MATFTIRFRALLTMTNAEPIENGQLVVENESIRDVFYDTSKPIEGELLICRTALFFQDSLTHIAILVFRFSSTGLPVVIALLNG